MKLKKIVCTALLSFLAASANAVVIDFDDLSGAGNLSASYAGLSWSNWNYYDDDDAPYTAESGSERIFLTDPGLPGIFRFASDVVFDGAFFAGWLFDDVTLELYNDGGLTYTSQSLPLSEIPTFLATGYAGLVDEVRVISGIGFGFAMDNVTYHAPASNNVPEPASTALLGLGLAGLMALRRKRRSRS